MRIVDTSGRGRGPEASVAVVPAAELIMLGSLLVTEDASQFDLDADRLAELRALVPAAVEEGLERLAGDDDKQLLKLVRRAVTTAEPRDPEALLEALGAASDEEVALDLLDLPDEAGTDDGLAVRALQGDADARQRLLEPLKDEDTARATRILDLGLHRVRELAIEVLAGLADDVWPAIRDEALAAIERDAEAKEALLEEHPTLRAIEAATNGYRMPTDPDLREILLVPSYVFRPWLLTDRAEGRQVLVYPVADESIELDPDRPSPQLVRLVKALADEGRLRLLRRLETTDLSLAEVADTLGVAKPTAHHHMALLRQAGLVSVSVRGRESCYSLRSEPARYTEQLLGRYLDA